MIEHESVDVEAGNHFWISGPRKDGEDRLYGGNVPAVEIDPDVGEEYWSTIRGQEAAAKG